jgi:hypothetical protein
MKHIIHLSIAVLVSVVVGNLLVALAIHYHL